MSEPRIALVTGASKGIGAAVARRLARDGCDIWLNYRSDDAAAREVARDIESAGGRCRLLKFDVADETAARGALGPLLEEGAPSVLVNHAGFARDALFVWMTREEWRDTLAVTLDGFFHVTRPVLLAMLKRRAGSIINVVSTSGQTGVPGQANYSAAKGGLMAATRSLAVEVAKRNVRVNAVAPGFIESEMTRTLPLDKVLPNIPAGRIGRPEEVADAVSFLCSPGASYIVGQVLSINGGAHM
jgi:3-oxoacyl-[acyl-carrier protein] reductase